MDSGFYAACTGLAAQTQALDVIAENLANTSTAAYKARQATFPDSFSAESVFILPPS